MLILAVQIGGFLEFSWVANRYLKVTPAFMVGVTF